MTDFSGRVRSLLELAEADALSNEEFNEFVETAAALAQEWEAMRAALKENDEDYRALTVELAKAEKERDKLRALLQAGTK